MVLKVSFSYFSYHKLPKLEKYLLSIAFASAVVAVILVSARIASTPVSEFGQAQTNAQVIKEWNFDKKTDDWKSRFTREAIAKDGLYQIRIGQTGFTPLIFNTQVMARMPQALKYFTINLAIIKNNQKPARNQISGSAPVENLSFQDLEILSLAETQSSPSATGEGIACPADVKQCPDGTYVGRVPPDCSFQPCPMPPYPYFTFNLFIKKFADTKWSGPLPITGRINSNFRDFTVKLPVFNPLIIEAIKIEFKNGISVNDVIMIDSIKLLNEKLIIPTKTPFPTKYIPACGQSCSGPDFICAQGLKCLPNPVSPADSTSSGLIEQQSADESTGAGGMPAPRYTCQNPVCPDSNDCRCDITKTPPPSSVPTKPADITCFPPPPCAFGVKDDSGQTLYCDPMPGIVWCPWPTPVVSCIPRPPCADGIKSDDGNYFLYCLPMQNNVWYPKPTSGPPPEPSTPPPPPTITPSTVCKPLPYDCIVWKDNKAENICRFLVAENWCPLPTCIPRPACLDSEPRCLLPEIPGMCPPAL